MSPDPVISVSEYLARYRPFMAVSLDLATPDQYFYTPGIPGSGLLQHGNSSHIALEWKSPLSAVILPRRFPSVHSSNNERGPIVLPLRAKTGDATLYPVQLSPLACQSPLDEQQIPSPRRWRRPASSAVQIPAFECKSCFSTTQSDQKTLAPDLQPNRPSIQLGIAKITCWAEH